MKRSVLLFPLFFLFHFGCSKREISLPGKDEVVNFDEDIQPIFDENCVTCHGGDNPRAGMSLERGKSYDNLVGVVSTGYAPNLRVYPGYPDSSVLYQKVSYSGVFGQGMPPTGKLRQEYIDLIYRWIVQLGGK